MAATVLGFTVLSWLRAGSSAIGCSSSSARRRRDRQRHRRLDVRGGAQRDARAGGRGRRWLWPRRASTCSTWAPWRPAAARRCRPRRRPRGWSRRSRAWPSARPCRSRPTPSRPRSLARRWRRRRRDQRHRRRRRGDARAGRGDRLRPGDHAYRGPAAGGPASAALRRPGRPPARWFAGRIEAAAGTGRRGGADRARPGARLRPQPERRPRGPAPARRAQGARPPAVRVALAQGLPRRAAGGILGEHGCPPANREWATAAAAALAVVAGADLLRLHDTERPAGHADRRPPSTRRAGSRLASTAVAGGAWEPALGPAREDGRLVAESAEPATMAKLADLPASLDPALAEALRSVGIESLYCHQAAAYETARRSHLILTSGTASGKSLSFNLPVLDGIAREPAPPCVLPLPDQGAGAGPGPQARRASPARAARGDL